jgi:hypothetical protein
MTFVGFFVCELLSIFVIINQLKRGFNDET